LRFIVKTLLVLHLALFESEPPLLEIVLALVTLPQQGQKLFFVGIIWSTEPLPAAARPTGSATSIAACATAFDTPRFFTVTSLTFTRRSTATHHFVPSLRALLPQPRLLDVLGLVPTLLGLEPFVFGPQRVRQQLVQLTQFQLVLCAALGLGHFFSRSYWSVSNWNRSARCFGSVMNGAFG